MNKLTGSTLIALALVFVYPLVGILCGASILDGLWVFLTHLVILRCGHHMSLALQDNKNLKKEKLNSVALVICFLALRFSPYNSTVQITLDE